MKHLILIIGIISSILQACQLTEVDGYVGGSSIYFSIQRDTMTYSWGTVDSDIQERVLELPIYLFGEVKDYDRKIQVRTELCKTDSVRAVEGVDFRAITKEVILPANCEKTSLQITMLRTEALRKYNRILTVVIEESEEFDSEFNWRKDSDGNPYFIGHSMTIISNEDFPKPWWWRDENDFFGVWSFKKADLICTLCDVSRKEFISSNVIPDFKLKYYAKKVQRWLDEQEEPYLDENLEPMTMGPQVIAVDEIGTPEDVHAIEYAMHCGCKMLATVHAESMEELRKKPLFNRMIGEGRFERYILLGNNVHVGQIEGIFDNRGSLLYKEAMEMAK